MELPRPASPTQPARPARTVPEFPGCRPITTRRAEIATRDGRLEFRDADTETALVLREPTGATHELPSQLLSALGHMIAAACGSPIVCLGTMDLELRGEDGARHRILPAGGGTRDRAVGRGPMRGLQSGGTPSFCGSGRYRGRWRRRRGRGPRG